MNKKQLIEVDKRNNIKKLGEKQFKLPLQYSIQIIDEVRKIEKYNKSIRPDQDRKQYKLLLQWVNTKLAHTKEEIEGKMPKEDLFKQQKYDKQTIQQQIQTQQRKIIQCLMKQMIQMFKKQCKQKSILMQICYHYFNQLINLYTKHYQKQINQTIKLYNINLCELEEEYEGKINQCKEKISLLESQKQTKWKNIYMLAKDNRILRRQKGKLLRNIQEQEEKMKVLQGQLCQVAKENQLNKLIIRFQNDSQNLKVFMKNRLALMKFQKIIQRYPQKAMKVLSNDLLKLQIQQLNSLDNKIDYIKRVITQSGDTYDEYQDLNEIINKPNKIVFNMYSQTQPQDIEPAKEFRQYGTNFDIEQISKKFQIWEQVYQQKIAGFPELKEKYVCFRNPNRKLTNRQPVKKKTINQGSEKKQFFVMQICQREVYQILNIKTKKRPDEFKLQQNQGVVYNPLLKKKNKLYFTGLNNQRMSSFTQDLSKSQSMDQIFRQTMPVLTKKSSSSKKKQPQRKSQVFTKKSKYAINKIFQRNSINQRNSEDLSSFENTMEQTENFQNDIIQERSQAQESNKSQTDAQIQDTKQNQFTFIKPLKNKKMMRRTITQSNTKGYRNSSVPKLSHFASYKQNDSSILSMKQTQNSEFKVFEQVNLNKTQRASTKQKSKRMSKINNSQLQKMRKTGRMKTMQNGRNSKNSNQDKKLMEYISEQEQQNQDAHQVSKLRNMKQLSRLSFMPMNTMRSSRRNDTMNSFGHSKESYLNQIQGILAQRNKKYNIAPNNTLIATQRKSGFQFNPRNTSMNMNKYRNRQSLMNADTCSLNSHHSSNNQSTFNYKKYINELKPYQLFQPLQTQNRDPIFIKPFQVKKLVEKIIRSIYLRKKQLLSNLSPFSLKVFIQSFLKQIYGNNWKGDKNILRYTFSIQDRQGSSNLKVFSLMLNTNVHLQYLQDLFRLYITMLQKNQHSANQNPLITNKLKGVGIMKYLLSIYFDQATATDIQQNLPFMNQYEIDLNEVFIVVQNHIRKYTIQTELYDFLINLMPVNQSNIQFSHLKQILYLFKNQGQKYHSHMARLKYFFKTNGKNLIQQYTKPDTSANVRSSKVDKLSTSNNGNPKNISKDQPKEKQENKIEIEILPIHRVCLYFKRYQWKDLIEINTFIEQKYHKMIGIFIQQESIKFITKYCSTISQRRNNKKSHHIGMMSIPLSQQPNKTQPLNHPLHWLLQRSKQMIRNYYRYKTPVHRYFLMFIQVSILTYELQIGLNQVLSQSLDILSLQYKKLKTKQQVDTFMKQ